MNETQQFAYDILQAGHNVFLTGSAGTGKSYVINNFKNNYQNRNELAITSTTGISALLIGGRTLHSWAGIGLGEDDKDVLLKKVEANPNSCKRWKRVKTLVIDEISMLKPSLFDKLNYIAKKMKNSDLPFGGIQIVMVGDFCQLPVIKGGGKFCFDSNTWKECEFITAYLTKIVRQDNLEFSNILQKIRLGICDDECKSLLDKRVGIWKKNTKDKNGIIPTKLYSTNKNVDEINNKELQKLIDSGNDKRTFTVKYDVKFTKLYMNQLENLLKFITKDLNNNLILTIGTQVMLTKNIDLACGLANGSRGVITDFTEDDLPIVKFVNGIETEIDYFKQDYRDEDNKIILKYIPLKLAWASTIHKCQGATLDSAVINLGNIFEYGQAYVALSRIRNLENLYITKINYDKINCHPNALKFYEALI